MTTTTVTTGTEEDSECEMLLRRFDRDQRRRGLSAVTIAHRRRLIGQYLIETPEWHAVTTEDVQSWLDRWDVAKTRSVYLSHLQAFYRWALYEELIPKDPTLFIARPKVP